MPRRQKRGEDNPKRRGKAPPFLVVRGRTTKPGGPPPPRFGAWGGAGPKTHPPPAFLLGVPKGEVLF